MFRRSEDDAFNITVCGGNATQFVGTSGMEPRIYADEHGFSKQKGAKRWVEMEINHERAQGSQGPKLLGFCGLCVLSRLKIKLDSEMEPRIFFATNEYKATNGCSGSLIRCLSSIRCCLSSARNS